MSCGLGIPRWGAPYNNLNNQLKTLLAHLQIRKFLSSSINLLLPQVIILQMDQQYLDNVRKSISAQDWERSDEYHNSFLIPQDDVFDAAVRNNKEKGLPEIAVSTAQGKFLHLLARSISAKKILEVGTLGG